VQDLQGWQNISPDKSSEPVNPYTEYTENSDSMSEGQRHLITGLVFVFGLLTILYCVLQRVKLNQELWKTVKTAVIFKLLAVMTIRGLAMTLHREYSIRADIIFLLL